MLKKRLAVFLLSVCSILSMSVPLVLAQTQKVVDIHGGIWSPETKIPFMKEARCGVLPNGLRYFILKNDTPKDRAFVMLVVNVGSVYEQDSERGVAHFVEHMVFQGTKRFPNKNDIINYFRSKGMRFAEDDNAYTTYKSTNYHFEIPTQIDSKGVKHIPQKTLEIIDDWTHAAIFNTKTVDEERLMILEEKKLYDSNISDIMLQKMSSVLYKGSLYADRNPIGLEEIIQTVSPLQLKNFYQKWYRPDNMAIIFVGDFDDIALEKSLSLYFRAPFCKSPLILPKYELPLPEKGHLNIEIFTDPKQSQVEVYLDYKVIPKTGKSDMATFRENVIQNIIKYIFNWRLEDEADKKSSPYTKAYSDFEDFPKPYNFLTFRASAKSGKILPTIESILREKERVFRYGFTEVEIESAKGYMLSYFEQESNKKDVESSSLALSFFNYIVGKDYAVVGKSRLLEVAKVVIPQITYKDVAEAVKKYFDDSELTIFVLASDKEKLPSKKKIKSVVEKVSKSKIHPFEKYEKEPVEGSIIKETIDKDTNAYIWELSNGAKVILQQTKNKNDEVAMYALAKGGIASFPEEDLGLPEIMPMSYFKYISKKFGWKLYNKQVSLNFNIDKYNRNLIGSSNVKDMRSLFEILYLGFTNLHIDSEDFNSFVTEYKNYITAGNNNHDYIFYKEEREVIYGDNKFLKDPELSDIANVNRSRALKLFKDLISPADYTFVFVGNIDVNTFRTYTEKYIASIKSFKVKDYKENKFVRPETTKKEIYAGKENRSKVYMGWAAEQKYSHEVVARAEVLSEYMNILFFDKLRFNLSGSYEIWSKFYEDYYFNELLGGLVFSCSPSRVKELISVTNDCLKKVADGNIDQNIFKKAKETVEKLFKESMQKNNYLANSYAFSYVIYNEPLDTTSKMSLLYGSVTQENLKDIANKLVNGKYYQVIMYPESYKNNNNSISK